MSHTKAVPFGNNVLLYGKEAPLPKQHRLQAGPLNILYEEGNLRYIRWGGVEVLRMIYSAVRDHNWGTVAPQISNEKVLIGENTFSISYDCTYQEGDIHFFAKYEITGNEDGKIVFSMNGEALSAFQRNRIGFCVLHPASAAGWYCRVITPDGEEKTGKFPKYISPHQPFKDIRKFVWEVGENTIAQLDFEGDVFEMEDQRNWTDASYKTYCTPLALPFPVQLQKSDKVQQKITLSLSGELQESSEDDKSLEFVIPENPGQFIEMPKLGVSKSSEAKELSTGEIALLQKAGFSHYRVDVKFEASNWKQEFLASLGEAEKLDLPLELALHFQEDIEEDLEEFLAVCDEWQPGIGSRLTEPTYKYILLFQNGAKSTPGAFINAVMPALRKAFPNTMIGAGTDYFFTELNRERPPTQGVDFLTYSVNPQVHQFDNASLVETLEVQGTTVISTRQFADGLPIHVSPVTLKMRNNPNATGAAPAVPKGALPPQVDVRQMSLFGAMWTLGSIKYLAEAGAKTATFFETVGMRGLMQGNQPPASDQFKAVSNQIFPLYFVFHELAKYPETQIIPSQCSKPLEVDGLVLQNDKERIILLGNMQAETKVVTIKNISEKTFLKGLDEHNVAEAVLQLEIFSEAKFTALEVNKKQIVITLKGYAMAFIRSHKE